jgi:hypothetical protein
LGLSAKTLRSEEFFNPFIAEKHVTAKNRRLYLRILFLKIECRLTLADFTHPKLLQEHSMVKGAAHRTS